MNTIAKTINHRTALPPRADVFETADGYTLLVDLPGVAADDADITIHEGKLGIRATRALPFSEETKEVRRSFVLPKNFDADAVEAVFEHGVLTITIGKAEAYKPKRIAIRGES